jgi:hypothetical protein
MLENTKILKQDQFLSSGEGVEVMLLGPLEAANLSRNILSVQVTVCRCL